MLSINLLCFSFIFLISGYFTGNNTIYSKNDVLKFYIKKVFRIYPLFICANVMMMICGYNDYKSVIFSIIGLGCIRHVPLTLWFVCVLIFYYIVIPLVLKNSKLTHQISWSCLIYVFFIVLHFMLEADERLFFYWPFFALGTILNKNSIDIKKYLDFTVMAISGSLFFMFSVHSGNELALNTYVCGIAFIYLITFIVYKCCSNTREHTIVEFISYGSMCIYMFHRPFYRLIQQCFGRFDLKSAYCIFLPMLIFAGWVIQYCYDKLLLQFETLKKNGKQEHEKL